MPKFRSLLLILVAAVMAVSAFSQTRKPVKKTVQKTPTVVATPKPTPDPTPAPVTAPAKRNGRPEVVPKIDVTTGFEATHIYKFSRPGFTYPTIEIQHDDSGVGTVTFTRDGSEESVTDPIVLTQATLKVLDGIFTTLNFLDWKENYQYEEDYSHLGNVEITLKQAGRERTAKYNWTENKGAKALMDEYRRLSNEYTWKFELAVAVENQPLLTPKILETLDSYQKRGELSDPSHLVPFLNQISNDERLPLIARNHAKRIAAAIEKEKKN